MKRILLVLAVAVTFMFTITSCTENQRAKRFGGNMTINLPAGQKLVEATWKNEDLWYLTRDRREGEVVEKFSFVEESSFGIIEGSVTFIEK